MVKIFGFDIPINSKADRNKMDKAFKKLLTFHGGEEDPWGLNLSKTRNSLEFIWPLYKNYFKVKVHGKKNVRDVPYMVCSNHSGQIAIDGMLITVAFSLEMEHPRILRSMIERFMAAMPFVGPWSFEGGAVLGDRQNCINLLKRKQSVLVFPEGVRGVSKSTKDFYKLQPFSKGFFRLALQTGTPVLPIAVIGAEEFFPFVYQAKGLAKMLGLPAIPVSTNYIPLPSPVDIYIGEEYKMPDNLSADSPDSLIDEHINNIENIIKKMTSDGLAKRRSLFSSKEE